MKKNKRLNRKKLNPHVPVFTGEDQDAPISAQLFKYNEQNYIEEPQFQTEQELDIHDKTYSYWLNIHGLHDSEKIISLCDQLGIHKLAQQDILDINQRPKFQNFESYWFFTLKSVLPSKTAGIELEQLSFVLGENYLISFQERKADYFDHVRHRIRQDVGIIRGRGTDYLFYLLLEAILDNYFKTVNDIEIKLENLNMIYNDSSPSPEILKNIEFYKREVHHLKKTLIPIKEFVTTIEREQFGMVDPSHIKYFYEIKDLCLTLIDDCDKMDMRLESNTNLFFSVQGHRMNQVMKTLTVVATIFIPITFIAGVYGMNFNLIPELGWKFGYPAFWLIVLFVIAGMLYYFKKKDWF